MHAHTYTKRMGQLYTPQVNSDNDGVKPGWQGGETGALYIIHHGNVNIDNIEGGDT